MRRSPKLRPTVWDALTAAAVAALAVVCAVLIWGGAQEQGALTAVITVDGGEADRVVLQDREADTRTVESNGYTLCIRFTDKEVWVASADCPTQDCVHTRAISRPGQSIVCLPARVVIQLEGGGTASEDDVDVVIG